MVDSTLRVPKECVTHIQPELWLATFIELDDGKIYRKTIYLMIKSMVSCRFSLKPIQWYLVKYSTMTNHLWIRSNFAQGAKPVRDAPPSPPSWLVSFHPSNYRYITIHHDIPSGKPTKSYSKSYWTWPFIVSFPMKNGGFSRVTLVYQRVSRYIMIYPIYPLIPAR